MPLNVVALLNMLHGPLRQWEHIVSRHTDHAEVWHRNCHARWKSLPQPLEHPLHTQWLGNCWSVNCPAGQTNTHVKGHATLPAHNAAASTCIPARTALPPEIRAVLRQLVGMTEDSEPVVANRTGLEQEGFLDTSRPATMIDLGPGQVLAQYMQSDESQITGEYKPLGQAGVACCASGCNSNSSCTV